VQLRFTSFAVASSREDLHLQKCAHAERTKKGGHQAAVKFFNKAILLGKNNLLFNPTLFLEPLLEYLGDFLCSVLAPALERSATGFVLMRFYSSANNKSQGIVCGNQTENSQRLTRCLWPRRFCRTVPQFTQTFSRHLEAFDRHL
jgi:hypothetical protein